MPRPTRSPGGPSRLRRDGLRGFCLPPLPFAYLHHQPLFPPSAAPATSTKRGDGLPGWACPLTRFWLSFPCRLDEPPRGAA